MKVEITTQGIKIDDKDFAPDASIFPWQIANDSVDEINCVHYLQVVEDVEPMLAEICRIAKPSCYVRFICPYYSSLKAHTDPRNRRLVNEYTLIYYNNDFRKKNNLPELRFSLKTGHVGFQWREEWESKSDEAKEFARLHYLNVVDDILIQVQVEKNGE